MFCFKVAQLLGIPEEFEHVFTFLSMSDELGEEREDSCFLDDKILEAPFHSVSCLHSHTPPN